MIQEAEMTNQSESGVKQIDSTETPSDLPLAINLFKYLKGKSFIDKKHCLNDHCAKQFHSLTINYFSENKLVL